MTRKNNTEKENLEKEETNAQAWSIAEALIPVKKSASMVFENEKKEEKTHQTEKVDFYYDLVQEWKGIYIDVLTTEISCSKLN